MLPHLPAIRDRRIRFALVGCGRISRNHIEAMSQHAQQAELCAVCDIDETALGQAHAATSARAFSSLTEVLSESRPDAVILATPSGAHAEQTILAANSGCHVITEKPMATRWQDGKHM